MTAEFSKNDYAALLLPPLAAAYVKENSSDLKEDQAAQSGVTVTLDKVDFSPARNSCIAELDTTSWFLRSIAESSSVRDLLSGETLFLANCTGDCVVVKPACTDPAFDYVMKNGSEPLGLEKAYAYYVAHSAAQGSPSPDSKHPPSNSMPDVPPNPSGVKR